MVTDRAELHALVDRLPVEDMLRVKRFCEALMAGRDVAVNGLPHGKVTLERLRELKPEILAIARQYHAADVRVFGSVARDEADEFSDVDFLVRFEKEVSLLDLAGLQEDLGDLLGCPVHVATESALRPEVRGCVLREAVDL